MKTTTASQQTNPARDADAATIKEARGVSAPHSVADLTKWWTIGNRPQPRQAQPELPVDWVDPSIRARGEGSGDRRSQDDRRSRTRNARSETAREIDDKGDDQTERDCIQRLAQSAVAQLPLQRLPWQLRYRAQRWAGCTQLDAADNGVQAESPSRQRVQCMVPKPKAERLHELYRDRSSSSR